MGAIAVCFKVAASSSAVESWKLKRIERGRWLRQLVPMDPQKKQRRPPFPKPKPIVRGACFPIWFGCLESGGSWPAGCRRHGVATGLAGSCLGKVPDVEQVASPCL
eukprot:GHVT01046593.1.p1 GENE.GHVT01046593.1~~GHVT01046593.1.p1  ORF type:complete len:106 (-),score=16.31 GHVT01046593.1:173-490(-)